MMEKKSKIKVGFDYAGEDSVMSLETTLTKTKLLFFICKK